MKKKVEWVLVLIIGLEILVIIMTPTAAAVREEHARWAIVENYIFDYPLTQVDENTWVYDTRSNDPEVRWEDLAWEVEFFRDQARRMGFDAEQKLVIALLNEVEFLEWSLPQNQGTTNPGVGLVEIGGREVVVTWRDPGMFENWVDVDLITVRLIPGKEGWVYQTLGHELAHGLLEAGHGAYCVWRADAEPRLPLYRDACFWSGVVKEAMTNRCRRAPECERMRAMWLSSLEPEETQWGRGESTQVERRGER